MISVLMTAYNREKYIGEAIESVLNSTWEDFELIVVDDCSVDNTLKIAQAYAEVDTRIKVYQNDKNLGDYNNRNKAASYAQGKYLKYLDADDIIYPHGLAVMLNSMEQFSKAAFGLSFSVIDDVAPYPRLITSIENLRSEYLNKSYLGVGPSASIIRRLEFERIGGFSGKPFIGDTEFWLKMASCHDMVLMNPSLVWWRQHPDQQMQKEIKKPEIIVDRFKLSLFFLEQNRDFFTREEYYFAVKKRKQHFARGILSTFAKKKKFGTALKLYRLSNLSPSELLLGFRSYY